MIDEIFAISSDVRYVAIYRDGKLECKSKDNTAGAHRRGDSRWCAAEGRHRRDPYN